MTLNIKMLRAVVAGVAGLAAAMAVAVGGGPPGVAAGTCQRSVAIDPQVTVSEAGRGLTFVVYTGGCAAAGEVSYVVTDGTAKRQLDFMLDNGRLTWAAGDTTARRITATIIGDNLIEGPFEDFRVALVFPSRDVRVASGPGQGRIFDDDVQSRLATVDSRTCLVTRKGDKPVCALPPGVLAPMDAGVKTFEPGHIIQVPLVLNEANATTQSAHLDTADGTLLGGVDYEPVHTTVHIPAGALVVFVEVKLLPNAFTHTSGHYFHVYVSGYTAGSVIAGSGQVTIVY
ncbi:Calx-beta domain-containing protein [Allorhizocola rhizosphaerae]|uniref:Calx-beta domain-containing protein n=1 Tax=Allorhizocola rhizosphaerae TaxID=1872709 RepID=UPI0013C2FBF8|nr:Calx-beta domain-containing protein [Allorhizocola rhizosphaerae]